MVKLLVHFLLECFFTIVSKCEEDFEKKHDRYLHKQIHMPMSLLTFSWPTHESNMKGFTYYSVIQITKLQNHKFVLANLGFDSVLLETKYQ